MRESPRFAMDVSTPAAQELRKAAGSQSGGLSAEWLPNIDSFRTLCLVPTREVLAVFNDLQNLTLAS
jgi:hypothetical protein